jgi:outer membrane protein assembly factor BamB
VVSGNPGFNGAIFGVDVPNDTVTYSRGRLYALRPDGTVAWESLLAGHIHGSPLFVPPSTDGTNPDGFIYVGTDNNGTWGGKPLSTPTGGRFYKIDAQTGQIMAEMFAPTGSVDGSALLIPGAGPGTDGAAAHIFFTDHSGEVFNVTQVVVAPPPSFESPTLTVTWDVTVGSLPTSPAESIDGTTIYVGYNQGMHAMLASTGATVWDVTQHGTLGAVVGSPAVVAVTGSPMTSQVIFGTNGAPSGIYDILDTGTAAPPIQWSFISPVDASGFHSDFGLSSPAIGPIFAPTGNSEVFIGSKEGGFFTIV